MSFAAGISSQARVVEALILRETRTRFGKHQIGYLWAVIEPTLLVLTFYAVFALTNRQPPEGTYIIGFLATGMIPYQVFRSCVDRSATAISANKALLYYPQIRPLELIVARATLELATLTSVFFILMIADSLIAGRFAVDSILWVLIGLGLAGALGGALGMLVCAGTVFSSSVENLPGIVLRPMFWISGIFFSVGALPSEARNIVLWNPVLHLVELVRSAWYPAYGDRYVDLGYVSGWILALAFAGLTLERVARRRLELT